MLKPYWKGHEVFQIIDYRNGCAKISYYCSDWESPITGTGCRWVDMSDVDIVEAEEEE